MALDPVELAGSRILVTGPSGQVAEPVVAALASVADVFGLARFNKREDRDRISALGVTCVAADLADPAGLRDLPDDFDYILNFAVVKTDDFDNLISQVENVWRNFDNSFAFEFTFLDQTIDEQYRAEQRLGKVFGGFSFLAIIIAAMGLFALASLMFANRAKEVGIRKVLGAQPANLVIMLLKNFTLLVIIGILIAMPIAWMIMSNWLQNFNFRIDLNPAIFILSAIGIIIIAWITLGYLTIKTATSNPIDSIRDE